MDSTKIEKFQAMKRYKRRTFFHRLINHILAMVVIGLFLSCPLWLPKLISSVKYFLFVFIPTVRNAIFSPKFLFFVCNVIVVFLLNEWKRSGSGPLKPDVYDEYVEERKSLTKMSSASEPKWVKKQDEKEALVDSTPEVTSEEDEDQEVVEIGDEGEEEETGEEEEEEEEEEGYEFLSAGELKKKFEDFIARINEQRRIEARMLICTNS